jgi:protein-tyrosine phosphatase
MVDAEESACAAGTWVLAGYVTNARDLGGVPLANGSKVACGAIYRSAALVGLGAAGCAAFGQLGIRTVIDLRIDAERLSSPDARCVTQQASIVSAPMPVPYSLSPTDYLADLNATAAIATAFDVLGDESAYPVLFHCTYGRDRSGVLAAVILLTLRATRDDVMAEYTLSLAGGVGAFPDSLNAVLDDIEQRGGVEAYLASAGITTGQLATLRARATAR